MPVAPSLLLLLPGDSTQPSADLAFRGELVGEDRTFRQVGATRFPAVPWDPEDVSRLVQRDVQRLELQPLHRLAFGPIEGEREPVDRVHATRFLDVVVDDHGPSWPQRLPSIVEDRGLRAAKERPTDRGPSRSHSRKSASRARPKGADRDEPGTAQPHRSTSDGEPPEYLGVQLVGVSTKLKIEFDGVARLKLCDGATG